MGQGQWLGQLVTIASAGTRIEQSATPVSDPASVPVPVLVPVPEPEPGSGSCLDAPSPFGWGSHSIPASALTSESETDSEPGRESETVSGSVIGPWQRPVY